MSVFCFQREQSFGVLSIQISKVFSMFLAILEPKFQFPLNLLSALTLSFGLVSPAVAQTFLEVDGRESIRFVPETVEILDELGLTLVPPTSTTTPAPGFDFGLQFIPPDSPASRRSNIAFDVIEIDGQIVTVPLGGVESFDTALTFDVDTSRLSLDPILEFDNFSTFLPENFFSPDFQVFVAEEDEQRNPEFRLFDVAVGTIDVDPTVPALTLLDVEITIAQEFSDFLQDSGAPVDTAGLLFIEARGDRVLQQVETTPTPVPDLSSSVFGMILMGVGLITFKRS